MENYDDRIVSRETRDEDLESEPTLRPKWLSEYIGQEKSKKN